MTKLETIWQIEKEAFKPEDRARKDFLARLIKHKKTILIYDNKGYALGRELEWDLVKDDNFGKHNTLYLISIGVIPEHQNNGIGRKLLTEFIKEAKNNKYSRVTLHSNHKGMIKLSESLGFNTIRVNRVDNKFKRYMEKWI